jgi:hypothetical protein
LRPNTEGHIQTQLQTVGATASPPALSGTHATGVSTKAVVLDGTRIEAGHLVKHCAPSLLSLLRPALPQPKRAHRLPESTVVVGPALHVGSGMAALAVDGDDIIAGRYVGSQSGFSTPPTPAGVPQPLMGVALQADQQLQQPCHQPHMQPPQYSPHPQMLPQAQLQQRRSMFDSGFDTIADFQFDSDMSCAVRAF